MNVSQRLFELGTRLKFVCTAAGKYSHMRFENEFIFCETNSWTPLCSGCGITEIFLSQTLQNLSQYYHESSFHITNILG